jgi:glycosyltransferase involved in cell wall biosynthesis
MKIVHILGKLNVGGSTHQVLHLASQLEKRGHSCTVLHGKANPDEQLMDRQARELGVSPIEISEMHNEFKLTPRIDLAAILSIRRLLREVKPDIVHTHSTKAGLIGRIAARLTGVPVVIHTFHGHLLKNHFGKWRSWSLQLMEIALRCLTTKLITVSTRDSHDLDDLGIQKREQIAVIPCGIDLGRFRGTATSPAWLRVDLEIPPDVLLFGAVGRHVPIKGYSDLIDAFALLADQRPKVALVLFGEGPLSSDLKSAVGRLKLDDRVFFMGSTDDVANVYAQLDFFVLPSLSEGLSVTLLEAMASNVPVIATEVGGTTEIVIHRETGLLCRPSDPADCAEKMIWAAEHKGQMTEMARRAKCRLTPTYDVEYMAAATSKLYEKLLRENVGSERRSIR